MATKNRADRLNTPGPRRRFSNFSLSIDQESFGVFAEWIARFMGSPAFLIQMTVFLIAWLMWNSLAPESLRFDNNPFILLTLILSIEAAYSAPLILLAQNRQEARDRRDANQDRKEAAQTKADMDFLAREIASVRMNIGDLATRDYLRSELKQELKQDLHQALDDIVNELVQERLSSAQTDKRTDKDDTDERSTSPTSTNQPGSLDSN